SVASFEMARGGRIDTVILGAYEVDQQGSVANWRTSDAKRGGSGGAMDLLSGKGDLIIVMAHVDSKSRQKLRRKCTYPLTGRAGAATPARRGAHPRRRGNRQPDRHQLPQRTAADHRPAVRDGGAPTLHSRYGAGRSGGRRRPGHELAHG